MGLRSVCKRSRVNSCLIGHESSSIDQIHTQGERKSFFSMVTEETVRCGAVELKKTRCFSKLEKQICTALGPRPFPRNLYLFLYFFYLFYEFFKYDLYSMGRFFFPLFLYFFKNKITVLNL